MTELLGVRETARRLGVHENTVRNWEQAGILAAAERLPWSGYRKFDSDDVEELKQAMQAGLSDPLGNIEL